MNFWGKNYAYLLLYLLIMHIGVGNRVLSLDTKHSGVNNRELFGNANCYLAKSEEVGFALLRERTPGAMSSWALYVLVSSLLRTGALLSFIVYPACFSPLQLIHRFYGRTLSLCQTNKQKKTCLWDYQFENF